LTIHQARSDLFQHFGNVLLLARGGSPAYAGPAKDMLGYFDGLGYRCPQHTNPADYALDLITIDLQEEKREVESRAKVERLIRSWAQFGHESPVQITSDNLRLSGINEKEEPIDTKTGSDSNIQECLMNVGDSPTKTDADNANEVPQTTIPSLPSRKSVSKTTLATPAELGALVHHRATFTAAFPLLLHRAVVNFRRQPPLLLARTMQVLGLGLVLALFFAPLHNDNASIQNRVGFVQEIGAFYFVGMLQNVAVYPAERDVFYREDDDGVYGV
jgi:hypothetical protein